jgi:hypothetical protein
MKQNAIVFSFGALAALGAAGWLRSWRPVEVAPSHFQLPEQAIVAPAAAPVVVTDQPLVAEPMWRVPQTSARTAVRRVSQPVAGASAPVSAETDEPQLRTRTAEPELRERPEARDAEQERIEGERDTTVYREPVVRQRSKKASIAIVAGSAAAGAAIGAAAGGGKGAAIGALAGGAGGYVYDRMTHKKRDTVNRTSDTYGSTAGYRDSDVRDADGHGTVDTLKRVGVGAAGGAALGGLAGGGKGAAIGAIAGGAGGYVYDRIKR